MRVYLVLVFLCLSTAITGCVSYNADGTSQEVDYVQAARTRISLGLTYLKNGNYTQAKINLDKALEFAPRLADSHYSMAYYFQMVGENERAEEYYRNAIKLAPRNPDIANSYGAFLCQQRNYPEAKVYFNRAVASLRYASSAETYENMAICAEKEGFSDEAIEHLRSAVKHQPSRIKTLVFLTELYMKAGMFKQAEETLNRIEKLGRIDADLLWLRMDLARQQGNQQKAKKYGDMLLSVYPNSPLAKQYNESRQSNLPLIIQKPLAEMALTVQSNGDSPQTHTVKKGENLFRISMLYNINMRTLIEWNELKDAGAIKAGMKLWLVSPQARP